MKTTIFVVFLIKAVVMRHHHHHRSHHQHHHILEFKNNTFTRTNEQIQNILNKLFKYMNLADQFIAKQKVKSLLTMLYDLNNIASSKFDLNDVCSNVTIVEVNNISIYGIDEMVRETVNEIQSKIYNNIIDKESENIVMKASTRAAAHLTRHMRPMSQFKDSREFKRFIGSFIGKINSLTVDDLFGKKPLVKARVSRRNLRVWEPPADLKDWFINSTTNRRIYKGKKTNVQTFPFVVSVHILQDFMCAGNIIQSDLILTAASCVQIHYNNRFYRENPRTTFVRIGSDWATRRGELIRVIEIYFHPSYDPKSLKNNIAILRLGRTINFQTKRRTKVRKIQLDDFDGNLPGNTREIIILGWGAKKPTQIVNFYEKLQVSFLQIYPVDECQKIYTKEFVNENCFCAGYISAGSGACNRDVGGPGVVAGRLVGIVSFGPPVCGAINAPTVFTRVGNYREWIENIMQKIPPRYGAPKTTRMTSKSFIYYYNTMTTRSTPKLFPINDVTPPALRAHEDNQTVPEETVLTEIISDLEDEQDDLVFDVINEAFTEEFYNTTIPDVEKQENEKVTEFDLDNNTLPPKPRVNEAQISTSINEVYDSITDSTTVQTTMQVTEQTSTVPTSTTVNADPNLVEKLMYEIKK